MGLDCLFASVTRPLLLLCVVTLLMEYYEASPVSLIVCLFVVDVDYTYCWDFISTLFVLIESQES